MAQGPIRGIETTIKGLSVKVGAIDQGDLRVIVLAVEKGRGTGNYSWELQELVDLIDIARKNGEHPPVRNFMEKFMEKVNKRLEELFGTIDVESDDDLVILNGMIENELTFKDNKIVYKKEA